MKFNNINHIIVLGGSVISLSFLKFLKNSKINYHFFTNKRMLDDKISNNRSLREHLKLNKINYTSTQNINTNKKIKTILSAKTLGIGFGQPWVIKNELLKKFNKKIVDFMGIPMPKYRGGAHYSWMILNDEKEGGCYIQNINEKTIQGSSDSGFYYLGLKYKYPKNLKIPQDFFNFSQKKEMNFLKSFIKKVNKNQNFALKKLNEQQSIFFPRLKNTLNGFIDWDNTAEEIVKFINAFSDPYLGAITYINNKKIYLKNASLVTHNNYHTFSAGLILNKYKKDLIVAAKKGIVKINYIKNIDMQNIKIGDRFMTERKLIEKSKKHFKI
jgi:methionyl-tRNA formyltransferase